MVSASIFLFLPAAYYVQRPYPSMYGVLLPCLRGLNSHRSNKQGGVKTFSFHQLFSSPLDSLSHQRNDASLSILYRYFHADYSCELINCMPPPLPWSRRTRLSISSHSYFVHFSFARVNQYLHSFIPFTSKLWNSLSLSVFPPAHDFKFFKRGVSRFLSC